MQHVERGRDALTAYHEYLQSDHDYQVWVEILTLEEREVGEAVLLDGQVNYSTDSDDGPERTASVVLSDPEGALQFGTQYAEDDSGTIWVNRLVRLKHEVEVPGWGLFTTTCMVGLPTAASRQGGEVGLELGDKSLLMDHGVRPRTFKRGTNVRVALVALCRMTGEHHYRIPKTDKKLSKPYTVGMGEDSLTPWAAFDLRADQVTTTAGGSPACPLPTGLLDLVHRLHQLRQGDLAPEDRQPQEDEAGRDARRPLDRDRVHGGRSPAPGAPAQ
jgi:hypothetical protein